MTAKEWKMVMALDRCKFTPASWDKRFFRSFPIERTAKLSIAQKHWLPALYYKYRRQHGELEGA